MTDNLSSLISDFDRLKRAGKPLVLATIVETQGSTYQKAGARMLIDAEGEFFGLLGGGCFEPDLIENSRAVFETGQPRLLTYDMRGDDDALWGLGLGCAGAVTVFLQRLSADQEYQPLTAVAESLAADRATTLITIIESGQPDVAPGLSFVRSAAADNGSAADLTDELNATADALTDAGQSRIVEHLTDGQPVRVFYTPVRPPPKLLLIGGGPDTVPVITLARAVGWHVTVIDYREHFVRPERFPGAHAVRLCPPDALADMFPLDRVDAAVLMTHRYEYDLRYLEILAGSPVRYLGLLGPTDRRRKLLESLDSDRARAAAGRSYGPVGLDLGGRRPEEIALSLVAQIQAVLNERDGGHLLDPSVPIKAAAEKMEKLHVIVLAAGGSTRFGALKQLLEFNGESLLRRAARAAGTLVGERVIVVHGPKSTKCQREIANLPVGHAVNGEWESGMASSLKKGLRALPADCAGALIMLCDQPLVGEEQLRRLAQAWCDHPEKIAASSYEDTIGVPAVFPSRLFGDLQRLEGDRGAQSIIEEYADDIIAVQMPEAGIDIDTQEDYAAALMGA